MITGLYAGLAGLFLIYLSLQVIKLRRGKKISVGSKGDADLERAVRVHGNFTEYAPISLILLFLVESNGLAPAFVHVLGATLIISRVVHFIGFRSEDAPGLLRVIGMVGTFLLILALAIIALIQLAFPGSAA